MPHTRQAGWFVPTLLAGLLLAAAGGCRETGAPSSVSAPSGQPPLPTTTIRVGDVALKVEIASTEDTRRQGFMFREPPTDAGMLFVWPTAQHRSFWMKNTPFDIDLAYIAPDGEIMQIERMRAYNIDSVRSRMPAQFVLEAAAGWFEAHGVVPGVRVTIPPEVTSAEDDSL